MKFSKVSVVYFSASYTTQKIVRWIGQELKPSFEEYDITRKQIASDIFLDTNEVLIVGMPVYAGRIPQKVVNSLKRFKGNDTPAILAVVYGNRDYEDALLELKDIVEDNFFKVISAGAFIARHSIFTPIASSRPDAGDKEIIKAFAQKSLDLINKVTSITDVPSLEIKGNRPYRKPGQFPIFPTTDESCNQCGKCARLCPAKAIPLDQPETTDTDKCWSCGRCLVICPQHSRAFRGEFYEEKLDFFMTHFSERKEPELNYALVK